MKVTASVHSIASCCALLVCVLSAVCVLGTSALKEKRAISGPVNLMLENPGYRLLLLNYFLNRQRAADAATYGSPDIRGVKRLGSEFLGKRMGSEFLGKRLGSEFLGKRMGSEFLGKRLGSEFLGKRTSHGFLLPREPEQKRLGSEFLGKRSEPHPTEDFDDDSFEALAEQVDNQPRMEKKLGSEFLGKRSIGERLIKETRDTKDNSADLL